MKICIDSGHCKLTPGKRSFDSSFFEYEFNFDVSNRIMEHLKRHGVDCYVQQIENADPKAEVNARVAAINKTKPDYVVSIHANAYGSTWNTANGWEIFCNAPASSSAAGTKLAVAIQQESKALGLKDRGIKDAHGVAAVVTATTPPAVLIEHGFYTNKEELAKLKSDDFRELCAVCDAKGILKHLGIAWIEKGTENMTEAKKQEHWGKKHLDSLVKKGLINTPEAHENSLDEPFTKAQIMALLDRLTDEKK